VQIQGLLGGLRVVLKQDEIGVYHAALAQGFFVLLCAIVVLTSRWWRERVRNAEYGPSSSHCDATRVRSQSRTSRAAESGEGLRIIFHRGFARRLWRFWGRGGTRWNASLPGPLAGRGDWGRGGTRPYQVHLHEES
jgi:hypothetical protein